jgi:hypothetical protein
MADRNILLKTFGLLLEVVSKVKNYSPLLKA